MGRLSAAARLGLSLMFGVACASPVQQVAERPACPSTSEAENVAIARAWHEDADGLPR